MEIKVKRRFFGQQYTIGTMHVDETPFCDTLEDTVRELGPKGQGKVWGATAIPAGTYEVKLAMSPKFHRILPRLQNVPFFEGILIHRGNESKDTAGCILLGENKVKGAVINSTPYELKLVEMCKGAEGRREKITITVE